MSTVANIYSTRLWSPNICRVLASERADIGWLPPGLQGAGVGRCSGHGPLVDSSSSSQFG